MNIGFAIISRAAALGLLVALTACSPSTPPSPTATAITPAELAEQLNGTTELTMVHVWATWCDPCRAEFPELVEVLEHYPNLNVRLVSADDPAEAEQVEAFLIEYSSPVGSLVSTELNEAFMTALSPNWAGSLPATFFYRDGKVVREWEGKRTFEEYAKTIEQLLNN